MKLSKEEEVKQKYGRYEYCHHCYSTENLYVIDAGDSTVCFDCGRKSGTIRDCPHCRGGFYILDGETMEFGVQCMNCHEKWEW